MMCSSSCLCSFSGLKEFGLLIFMVVQKLEVAEFSGLRSSSCVTFAKNAREASFFDAVAAQLTPKVLSSAFDLIIELRSVPRAASFAVKIDPKSWQNRRLAELEL